MIIDVQKNIEAVAEDIATEIVNYIENDLIKEDKDEYLLDLRSGEFYNMNSWISEYTDDIHNEAFERVMKKLNIEY